MRDGFRKPRALLVAITAACLACTGEAEDTRGPGQPGDGDADTWAEPGRSYLELGVRNQAIHYLERALQRAPDTPTLQADLAAALLLQDSGDHHVADHVRALELATRAFALDSASVRACRSRARALELLFLKQQAIETLDACLRLGVDAKTANAMRNARDELARPDAWEEWDDEKVRLIEAARSDDEATLQALSARFPSDARDLITGELMLRWADHVAADRHDHARRDRQLMKILSDELALQVGDRFAADAVAALERGDSVEVFIRAFRDYRRAVEFARALECEDAEKLLRRARDVFEASGSPFSHWASFRSAVCDYSRHRFEAAETALASLRQTAENAGYLSLVGSIRWMEGLTMGRQRRIGPALRHFESAAETFASIRDESKYAGVARMIASVLDLLGRTDDAWDQRRRGLARLEHIRDSRSRHQVLFEAAMAASDQTFPNAAVAFEQTGVESSRERADAVEFITGSCRLAAYLDAAGRMDEARHTLDDARAWLGRVSESARPQLEAEVAAGEGRLLLASNPADAVQAFDKAITYFEPSGQNRLALLYPLRGRANLDAGRLSAAEADFTAGIEFLESRRGDVFDQDDRISYADVVHRAYDEMIRFQVVALRCPDVALAYAERSRARLLLERVRGEARLEPGSLLALDAQEIRAKTPEDTALVYYALLDDRLLIWASAAGSLHHVETALDTRRLARRIGELRNLLELSVLPPRARELLEELYDLLIRPIASNTEKLDTLVVLPDKALHLVPFAALLDRNSGRHLVEDHQLAVAPSATLLFHARRVNGLPEVSRAAPTLIVANPTFDREAYPLPNLVGAESEARRLQSVYDRSTVLVGAEATRQRFFDELSRSAIVHFAGHAMPNNDRPSLSRLLLAPDPENGDPGVVLARDLYASEVGPTQLVVLAACNTASGHVSAAEGPISLARPFLASGVPTILATLWRIDDTASPELFARFHEVYRDSANALAALRTAQLWMLDQQDESLNRPGAWAATQVFLGAGIPGTGGSA